MLFKLKTLLFVVFLQTVLQLGNLLMQLLFCALSGKRFFPPPTQTGNFLIKLILAVFGALQLLLGGIQLDILLPTFQLQVPVLSKKLVDLLAQLIHPIIGGSQALLVVLGKFQQSLIFSFAALRVLRQGFAFILQGLYLPLSLLELLALLAIILAQFRQGTLLSTFFAPCGQVFFSLVQFVLQELAAAFQVFARLAQAVEIGLGGGITGRLGPGSLQGLR